MSDRRGRMTRGALARFVAQPVNVFHSSQSCSWPGATEHRGTAPGPTQFHRLVSGAKSREYLGGARLISLHPTPEASSLIAQHRGSPQRETPEVCGQQGAARRANQIPDRVPNASIATPTAPFESTSANKGTTSMPSRERHALKQSTADRRSKHARTHSFTST